MSISRKRVICAIAIAMVFVLAGNVLAVVPVQPPQQQDQKPNNNWVVPVAIVVGGIVIYLVWGLVQAGGI